MTRTLLLITWVATGAYAARAYVFGSAMQFGIAAANAAAIFIWWDVLTILHARRLERAHRQAQEQRRQEVWARREVESFIYELQAHWDEGDCVGGMNVRGVWDSDLGAPE
jgi:hypothetical protein